MHCPFCHNPDSRVVDTRIADDGASIRRRRECTHCKKRFTTLETSSFQVVKRSGVVESFSRNKVVSGVKKACQGRPVSDDQLAILAQQVEEQLRSTGVSNVSTNEVGKAILPFLRDLDVIAYLRFASVYRQFDTLDDFEQAIQALRVRAQGGDAAPETGAHAHVEPAAPAPAKKPRKARSSRKRSVSNAPT
ncbi:MAG: transcriptional repressor NrdR, partial [Thermobifida sp.]|nr:transcriptional repressor NrdR [Thermobifida sp.]